MMEELQQLKKGLEWQTSTCQTYVNSIKTKITELRTSTKMVYKDVDTQVDRIILATKKLGQNIKDERRKTHDDIMKTLTTLSDDASGILHQLQTNIKSSAQLLKDAPTVEMIKHVQMIRFQKKENDTRTSYLPDVPLSTFSTSEINEDALQELFGFVERNDSFVGQKRKRPRTDEGLQNIVRPIPAPCKIDHQRWSRKYFCKYISKGTEEEAS
ncbi:hypothetical protein SNE40_022403 [Patella caerulea]|uniref:Uncharacterized protein n=1 Tax=Patella caerulea TaxID=87958 RepID=A0AAN8IXK8_PATCE